MSQKFKDSSNQLILICKSAYVIHLPFKNFPEALHWSIVNGYEDSILNPWQKYEGHRWNRG